MSVEGIVHVDESNWPTEVMGSDVPVLVDFWAEWCGPCKALAPTLDELSATYAGRLKIAKVDVDQAPQLAGQFGVRSIPTLLFIKGGTVQSQLMGNQPKAALAEAIEGLLG